jgi:hypothetical protein
MSHSEKMAATEFVDEPRRLPSMKGLQARLPGRTIEVATKYLPAHARLI